MDNKPKTK